jgi:hypothetical protein
MNLDKVNISSLSFYLNLVNSTPDIARGSIGFDK